MKSHEPTLVGFFFINILTVGICRIEYERTFVCFEEMSMSEMPQSRGELTRCAILQAAHDLFIRQGYHGTSMRQIAADAHIALGGLYNHFSSKEAVFEAVFLAFHPYHEVFPLILEAKGSSLEQLVKDAIQRMMQAVGNRPDYMNLMFIEMVEFKSVHARQLFASLLPQGLQILEHLVEPYPEQIRAMPSPMVLRTFLGLFFGYYLTEMVMAQGAPPEFSENSMQYFTEVFLHGIMVEGGEG
jgi:AcrR family transcriptional regulator